MADLLDEILQGVPNVSGRGSAPSVFGPNAVSFEQANRITRDRVNAQSQLLETRSRFNKLNREEQTRIEAQKALNALSQLDPRSDPDYMDKVQGILAENPNASLDGAVSNFLGVQSGIYEDAEADRDAEAELERRRVESRKDFRTTRKRNRILNEDSKEFRDEAELEDTIDKLSPVQRELYDEYSESMSPKKALQKTMDESQKAAELNAAYESGFTEQQLLRGIKDADGNVIEEPLVDEKGRLDPTKLAKAVGAKKRAEEARARLKREQDEKQARLEDLIDYQETLQDPLNETATDERKKLVAESIDKLQKELGLLPQSGGSPAPAPANPNNRNTPMTMRDNTRVVPSNPKGPKDTSPADRYRPR